VFETLPAEAPVAGFVGLTAPGAGAATVAGAAALAASAGVFDARR
jgi:hypothetical protein